MFYNLFMFEFNFLKLLIRTNGRVFLLLGFLVLSAYAVMLPGPFKVLDDDFSIVNNAEIRSLKNFPEFFRSTYFKSGSDYYRPLVYVTYALEYHFFRLNHFFYNLDNVLLHVLNAWLVFLIAALITSSRFRGLAVAVLFAIHPIHWEAVGNVSGRSILLCAFFVLSGFYFFIRFARGGRGLFLFLSAACYVAGLLSKESAGMLAATLGVYWFFLERSGSTGRSGLSRLAWTVPFIVIAGLYLFFRHAMGMSKVFPWGSAEDLFFGVMTFLKGLLVYIRLFFIPLGLYFDRALDMFRDWRAWDLWAVACTWGGVLYFLWRVRSRVPSLILFCLAWFLVEMFPVSQIVTSIGVHPGAISLAEHFVYVASVPVFILMVEAGFWIYARGSEGRLISPGTLRMVFVSFGVSLFLLLVAQNFYVSNEMLMIRDSLEREPGNARLQYSLGLLYVRGSDFSSAEKHFRRSVELSPGTARYRVALGKVLADKGDLLAAARVYESIPFAPEVEDVLAENKEAVYRLLAEEYREKARLAPDDVQAHFALGVFYSRLSLHRDALEAYRRAVALRPDHVQALFNLAATLEVLGDRAGAREAYARAVRIMAPSDSLGGRARERLEALQ
jgi:tetratricopeptide (TPR) repeat protein